MITGPTNTRVVLTRDAMPAEYLEGLDADEKAHIIETGEFENTSTIYVVDLDKNSLFAYAVIGPDDVGMFMIYAARTMGGLMAEIALRSFFGVAQVLGKPLRVHTDKMKAFARVIGATDFEAMVDGDGLPQGVFHG